MKRLRNAKTFFWKHLRTIASGIFILSFLLIAVKGNSQNNIKPDPDTLDISISKYDRYCPIMGGDTLRVIRGIRLTGFFKDAYPSGRVIHKGYYDDGKLVTMFTNYYESGQIERVFKAKSETRGTIEIYFPSGQLKSKGEFIKGEPVKWEDYYPDGKMEFSEEFSRNLEYHLYSKMFYESGKPQIIFEIFDEKNRKYNYSEYYETGQIKQKGQKIQNKSTGDYKEDGKWSYFDEGGKLTLEEEYEKGFLLSDKKYK
jgi:antitoxin component YwqK of YwqJK toxin-antitoxin module